MLTPEQLQEVTDKVTEALRYADKVRDRQVIGYAETAENERKHGSFATRNYTLKDARYDAKQAARLLREAWQILDPTL